MKNVFNSIALLALPIFIMAVIGCNLTPVPDRNELKGNWTGRMVGDPDNIWKYEFYDSTMRALYNDLEYYRGAYTVNTAATPKQLNVYIDSSLDFSSIGKTVLAIYKISNDTLTLAGKVPGETPRPVDFVQNLGAGIAVTVMEKDN